MNVIILLEVQNKEIRLWVNNEMIKTWKAKYTGVAGAPVQLARHIEAAFAAAHVSAVIECGDGFEDLAEYL